MFVSRNKVRHIKHSLRICRSRTYPGMRPLDIQPIGNELAIRWDDGGETFIALERLRRACPCAACKGETDVMGNLYKGPERSLTPPAFRLVSVQLVGGYAIQPVWGDGHSTGLYSFEYLQRLGEQLRQS
jgi:DUF971 family protein